MKKLCCLSFFIVSILLNTLSVNANNEHIIGDFKKNENINDFGAKHVEETSLFGEENNNNGMFSAAVNEAVMPKVEKEEQYHFRNYEESFSYTDKDNKLGTNYGNSFYANDDNNDMDIEVVHIPFIEAMDMNSRNVKCLVFTPQDDMSTLLSCDYMEEENVNNVSIHCDSIPSFINNSIHKTMNCRYNGKNMVDQITVFRNLQNLNITMMFKCVPKIKEQTYDNNSNSYKTLEDTDPTNGDKEVSANQDELQITCTLIDEYQEEHKIQTDLKQDDNSLDFSNIKETNVKYVRINNFLKNQEFNWTEQNKQFKEDDFELKFGAFAQEILNESPELMMLSDKISLVFSTHFNSQEYSDKKEIISVNFNFLGNNENFKNILGVYNVQYKKNYDSSKSFKQGSLKGCLMKNNFNDSQSGTANESEQETGVLTTVDELRNECNEFLQKYIDDICLYTSNNKNLDPVITNNLNTSEIANVLNNSDKLNNNINNNKDDNNVYISYGDDMITPPNGKGNVIDEFSENISDEYNEQWSPLHESQINAQAQVANQNNNENISNQQAPKNILSNGEASNLTVNKLLVNPKTKNRFFTLKDDSSNNKTSVITLGEFYTECSDEDYTLHNETIIELIEKAGEITSTKKKNWFSDETVEVTNFSEIQVMATLSENIEKSIIENDLKTCKLNKYLYNEFKKMQLSSAFNMALSAIVGFVIMCLFF